MNRLLKYLACGVFALIGLVATFFAFQQTSKTTRLISHGLRQHGTVTGIEQYEERTKGGRVSIKHRSRIQYPGPSGEKLETTHKGSYQVGSDIPLLVNPNDPNESSFDTFGDLWGGPILLIVIGLIFCGIGFGVGYKIYTREKQIDWLMKHGEKIEARVIGVNTYSNRIKKSSGRTSRYKSYEIVCEGRDPLNGQLRRYISDRLSCEPTATCVGSKVNVLVDPSDPETYFVHYIYTL